MIFSGSKFETLYLKNDAYFKIYLLRNLVQVWSLQYASSYIDKSSKTLYMTKYLFIICLHFNWYEIHKNIDALITLTREATLGSNRKETYSFCSVS